MRKHGQHVREKFEPHKSDLDHLNPYAHKRFARYLANCGRLQLREGLEKAWGVYYSQDGLTDVKQIGKEVHTCQ